MFTESDLVSSYSRAQALEDGVLIDVTEAAKEAGFRLPVAVTHAVWVDCVLWGAEEKARKETCQDQNGRLWDVVYMAFRAAQSNRQGSQVDFVIHRVPREGKGITPQRVPLVLSIGPGDTPAAVLTIMQPGE